MSHKYSISKALVSEAVDFKWPKMCKNNKYVHVVINLHQDINHFNKLLLLQFILCSGIFFIGIIIHKTCDFWLLSISTIVKSWKPNMNDMHAYRNFTYKFAMFIFCD